VDLEQAYTNLANLLMNARIKLNGDALTAMEHQQVNTDLQFIHGRAIKVDSLQEALNSYASENLELKRQLEDIIFLKEQMAYLEAKQIVDEAPDVSEEKINEDKEDGRTE